MITDLSYLESMAGGDREFIREMIDIFREQIDEYSHLMPDLNEKSNYTDLARLAHKAKSSVAVMGMNSEVDLLKELEVLAKEEKKTEIYEQYIHQFLTNSKKALEELEEAYKV